jgi:cell wall-associated NlpC family hydrolase
MNFLYLELDQQEKFVKIANKLVGIPYKYGAEVNLNSEPEDIKELDCSELVQYLFYKIGVKVPDGSYNQYDASFNIPDNKLEIGDLLFMRSKKNNLISHVGTYLGCGQVIEANGFYGRVLKTSIPEFSKETPNNKFAGFRRFLVNKIKFV